MVCFESIIVTVVNTTSYAIIICEEYPVVVPGVVSKGKVRMVWYFGNILFNFNRNAKGLQLSFILLQYFRLTKSTHVDLLNLLAYVPRLILICVLQLGFRIAIAYFTLRQQTDGNHSAKKRIGELNLLKSRVRPLLFFNCAERSIYYKVYKADPPSAGLIEQLADIMRYFVDEKPKG